MSSNISRIVFVSVFTLIIGRSALAVTPQQKCSAAKLKAAGRDLGRQMGCYAIAKRAAVAVDPECLSKVQGKADTAITKAGTACLGAAADIDAAVNYCIDTFLFRDPGNGLCPARSATVIGKGARGELMCQAMDVRTPGRFAVCDTKEDSKTTDGLTTAGECVSYPDVAGDIEFCNTIITDSIIACGDASAPTCGGGCFEGDPGVCVFVGVGNLPECQCILF